MGQLIFTFTLNSETQEAAIAGNIDISTALHVLQSLAVADGVNKRMEIKSKEEKEDGI